MVLPTDNSLRTTKRSVYNLIAILLIQFIYAAKMSKKCLATAILLLSLPFRMYGSRSKQAYMCDVWCTFFLQRVSIACYAERCISHDRFCLTVRPSVTRWHHAKTTPATIMRSSLKDSPMILVSSRLTSPRNSKGNIGSEGAEWERGSKNVAKIGNF